MDYDVAIIGGAFSGAATALVLKRRQPNARVLIIEKTSEFDRKVGESTTEVSSCYMNLVIPSSSAANLPVSKSQVQTISIDRAETIRINDKIVDAEALTARLLELKLANPEVAIVIRPDRELPVQKLVTLMDSLQRAQITKIGIATKAEAK